MSAVNVRYGLYPGDRLMVTAGKKKKRATVVKEYPFHILMDGSQLRNGKVGVIDIIESGNPQVCGDPDTFGA